MEIKRKRGMLMPDVGLIFNDTAPLDIWAQWAG